VAVDAELGRIGKIRAELDEKGPEVFIQTVEIVEVHIGAAVIDPRNGAPVAKSLAHRPGHTRLFPEMLKTFPNLVKTSIGSLRKKRNSGTRYDFRSNIWGPASLFRRRRFLRLEKSSAAGLAPKKVSTDPSSA